MSADGPRSTVSDQSPASERAARWWLVLGILALLGFIGMTYLVATKFTFSFDQPLLAAATPFDTPSLHTVWDWLSQAGNLPMIPIAILFVLWLWHRGRHREAVVIGAILAIATVSDEAIRFLVARVRPSGPQAGIPGVVNSYPSGHAWEDIMTLGSIAIRLFRMAIATVIRVGFAVLVTVFVVLVGFARLALDAHFPSDVLAGVLAGIFSLGLYAWASRPGSWADHPQESDGGVVEHEVRPAKHAALPTG